MRLFFRNFANAAVLCFCAIWLAYVSHPAAAQKEPSSTSHLSSPRATEDAEELITYIRKLDVAGVRDMTVRGVDVNTTAKLAHPLLVAAGMEVTEGDVPKHLEIVNLLLAHGADINAQSGSFGGTIVSFAARGGNCHIIEKLLKTGFPVNKADNQGDTPLMIFASIPANRNSVTMERGEKCARYLIENGADVNARNKDGATPLQRAATNGRTELLRLLLEKKANLESADEKGNTPLMAAAAALRPDAVETLIASGAAVDARNKDGDTPLLLSMLRDQSPGLRSEGRTPEAVAQLLLQRGANANAANHAGMTPLLAACLRNYDEAVKLLLENKADPNAKDNRGLSALDLSVSSAARFRLLLEHGADVREKKPDGRSLVDSAISCGCNDTLRLLIEKGLDRLEDGSKNNDYAVQAARRNSVNTLRVFLETGTESNAKSSWGETLLMAAASRDSDAGPSIWLLLDQGAQIDATGNEGETALIHAARYGGPSAVRALLERGANPGLRDIAGKTARDYAQERVALDGQSHRNAGDGSIHWILKNSREVAALLDGTVAVQIAITKSGNLPVYVPNEKIELAIKQTASHRAELAREYYYGLKNVPQDYVEAYYWFSTCDYDLDGAAINVTGSHQKLLLNEDHGLTGGKENIPEALGAIFDPQIRDMCRVFLKTLAKKLTAQERIAVQPRIDAWIAAHPRLVTDPILETKRRKTARLVRAVRAPVYDLEGLAAIIADGADINMSSVLMDIAAKRDNKDILTFLQEVKKGADPMTTAKKLSQDAAQTGSNPPSASHARDVVDHPSNEKSSKAETDLRHGTSLGRTRTISAVLESPGTYNPPALEAVSDALFAKFRDDEAVFWHLAGQLRKNQSEALCPRKGEYSYPFSGEPPLFSYYKYMRNDQFNAIISKVIEWDRQTPYRYNLQYGPRRSACIESNRVSAETERNREEFPRYYTWEDNFSDARKKPDGDALIAKAESGDAAAQETLWQCYSGLQCTMPNDYVQRGFDAQAAQEKEQESHPNKIFATTDDSPERARKGLYWLQKSVAQNYGPALADMAQLYMQGNAAVAKNPKKACELMLEMAKSGNLFIYYLAGIAPWNPHANEAAERAAWYAVRHKVETGKPYDWSTSALASSEIETARTRSEKYIHEYVSEKKAICNEANPIP